MLHLPPDADIGHAPWPRSTARSVARGAAPTAPWPVAPVGAVGRPALAL